MNVVPEGSVVYGMQLPVQAQSELFVADWERTSGPDELVAMARKADETGFFYIAVYDQIGVPQQLAPAMGTTWYDTAATLGMLAGGRAAFAVAGCGVFAVVALVGVSRPWRAAAAEPRAKPETLPA